jgi:hypothetical protein
LLPAIKQTWKELTGEIDRHVQSPLTYDKYNIIQDKQDKKTPTITINDNTQDNNLKTFTIDLKNKKLSKDAIEIYKTDDELTVEVELEGLKSIFFVKNYDRYAWISFEQSIAQSQKKETDTKNSVEKTVFSSYSTISAARKLPDIAFDIKNITKNNFTINDSELIISLPIKKSHKTKIAL